MAFNIKPTPTRYALEFDGVDDGAQFASTPTAFAASGWTASIWLSAGTMNLTSVNTLVTGDTVAPSLIVHQSDYGFWFRYRNTSDAVVYAVLDTLNLQNDGWHHYVAAAVPDDGVSLGNGITFHIWRDGVRLDDVEVSDAKDVGDLPIKFVGASNNTVGASGRYMGQLGPLGVWPEILTESDVLDLYRRPTKAACWSRVGEGVKLDEGTGDPVGVQGNTLPLTGPAWVIRPPQGREKGVDITVFPASETFQLGQSFIAEEDNGTNYEETTYTDSVVDSWDSLDRETHVQVIAAGADGPVTYHNRTDARPVSSDGVVGIDLSVSGWSYIDVTDRRVTKRIKVWPSTRIIRSNFADGKIREWKDYVAGSWAGEMLSYLKARIPETFSDDENAMFSAYNPDTGEVTANPDFWLADVDLSGISIWNSDRESGQKGGTLVTDQHMLGVAHWPLSVGDTVKFRGASGTIYTRTIAQRQLFGSRWEAIDISLYYLDSALPADVKPFKILPLDQFVTTNNDGMYHFTTACDYADAALTFGLPCCWVDQDRKAYTALVHAPRAKLPSGDWVGYPEKAISDNGHLSLSIASPFLASQEAWGLYDDPTFLRQHRAARNYDSGSPVFCIVDGEPVLLTCLKAGGGGTDIHRTDQGGEREFTDMHAELVSAMTTMAGEAVSFTEADLSDYTNYA